MEGILAVFIPLGMCVVLPIMCVWLSMRKQTNDTNKRTEIALEAIRNNVNINVEDIFKENKTKKNKLIKEKLLGKLQTGCVFLAIGLGFIISDMVYAWAGGMKTGYFMFFSLIGVISTFVGLSIIIVYIVSNKRLVAEMEAEVKVMEAKAKAEKNDVKAMEAHAEGLEANAIAKPVVVQETVQTAEANIEADVFESKDDAE